MKFINYFASNARQWDKLKIEWRLGGLTLLEVKSDISNQCGKIVIFNFGFKIGRTCKKCTC